MNKFMDGWLKHRRELKKEKIKNKKYFNWTAFWITIIIFFIISSLALMTLFTITFTNAFISMGEAISKNPGILLTSSDNEQMEILAGVSFLKDIGASGNLNGRYEARWTIKENRELEKIDLTCIDEYAYYTLWNKNKYSNEKGSRGYNNLILNLEEWNDKGCIFFKEEGNRTYVKCPKKNCQLREKITEEEGNMISERLIVSKVSAEVGQ